MAITKIIQNKKPKTEHQPKNLKTKEQMRTKRKEIITAIFENQNKTNGI